MEITCPSTRFSSVRSATWTPRFSTGRASGSRNETATYFFCGRPGTERLKCLLGGVSDSLTPRIEITRGSWRFMRSATSAGEMTSRLPGSGYLFANCNIVLKNELHDRFLLSLCMFHSWVLFGFMIVAQVWERRRSRLELDVRIGPA